MADLDEGPFRIRAGWLIDGTGRPALRDVHLRIERGMIAAIEKAPPTTLPLNDLSHRTLLPPLVDCHVHLFMSGTIDPDARRRQLANPFPEAAKIIAGNLQAHLMHGVLAVRDGGDRCGFGLRYRRTCMPRGSLVHVRAPGRAWHAPGRYGSLIGRSPGEGNSLARSLREDANDWQATPSAACPDPFADEPHPHPDHVKIVNSGLNSLIRYAMETPPQFDREELKAAVQAAAGLGLATMIHANGRHPVRDAIASGCRSVEHGFFMGQENLCAMAARPVTWVPTACAMKAHTETMKPGSRTSDTARRTMDHQLEQLSLARDLGVITATGTDCGSPGVDHGIALRAEIGLFVQAGYSIEEALRCATWNGARLLGLDQDMGVLTPGMPATFLAVGAAPGKLPEALDRIDGIFVRGRKVL